MPEIYGNKRFLAAASTAAGNPDRFRTVVIEGPAGSGKTELARYFAAVLLCTDRIEDAGLLKPCGVCRNCRRVFADTHPDVVFIQKDKKKVISVEYIRNIKRNTYTGAHEGGKRIFITEHAEEMNEQGQNALLKLLEEPPEGAYFLLLCYTSSVLLPTVLSRASVFVAEKLSAEDILNLLKEKYPGTDESKLLRAAETDSGNAGSAINELKKSEHIKGYAEGFAKELVKGSELGMLLKAEEVPTGDTDSFLSELRTILYEGMVIKSTGKPGGETAGLLASSFSAEALGSFISALESTASWRKVNIGASVCFAELTVLFGRLMLR